MFKKLVTFLSTLGNTFLKFFSYGMIALASLSIIIIIISDKYNLEKFYLLFNSTIQILFTLYVFVITINYSLLFLPKDKMIIIKNEFTTNIKKTRNSLVILVFYFIANFLNIIFSGIDSKTNGTPITDTYSISDFASINIFNLICFIVMFWFVISLSENLIKISQKIYDNIIKNE